MEISVSEVKAVCKEKIVIEKKQSILSHKRRSMVNFLFAQLKHNDIIDESETEILIKGDKYEVIKK